MKRFSRTLEFLKTTAIGGVLFLMPIAGLLFVLGYLYRLVLVVYKAIESWLPIHSAAGFAVLFLLSLVIVVLGCFFVGLIASRSIAMQSTIWIESNLLKVFPKYAIYKDILTGTLGGTNALPSLKPIRVEVGGVSRLAFETSRRPDGTVTVYFPGAPDPWAGFLGEVSADRISQESKPFSEAISHLEQLGRPPRKLLKDPGEERVA